MKRRDSSARIVWWGFASSSKLQSYFVDMHSGQGQVDDYDTVEYGNVDGDGDVSEGEGRFMVVIFINIVS